MDSEIFGPATDRVTNLGELLLVDTCRWMRQDLSRELFRRLEVVPGRSQPFTASRLVVLAAIKAVIEHAPDPLLVLVDVLIRESAFFEKFVDILVKLRLNLI